MKAFTFSAGVLKFSRANENITIQASRSTQGPICAPV